MKNFIAVFMLFINFFSCQAQDTIIISKTFWGTLKNPSGYETIQEAIPINTEQMVLRFDLLTYLSKINGLEKLPNLIYLLIGHNMHDLSILEKLDKIKVLILENIREPINLTFLKNMPRLKILYINSIFMMEDEFDFQNNKALEFVYLSNIRSNQRKGIFELTVKNLPKSLQYIDLSMSPFIILNDNLFNQLKDINWVIIDDFKYYPIKPEVLRINDQYIKNHQFIKATDDSEEILPEKYQRKQIYGLFGLE